MGLDYVDIFYSHRPDPATPIEETMGALAHAVRSGKALYVGISNYDAAQTAAALAALQAEGVPCLLHQMRYSMLQRDAEHGLFALLETRGVAAIAYSPLAQGLLTNRYAGGVPADSRAGRGSVSLSAAQLTQDTRSRVTALAGIATARGQSLAQLALAWVLRQPSMASALIGASRVDQLEDNLAALGRLAFDAAELAAIDRILSDAT
jgi:L-glyceraldehyde 3-phosphate reductase